MTVTADAADPSEAAALATGVEASPEVNGLGWRRPAPGPGDWDRGTGDRGDGDWGGRRLERRGAGAMATRAEGQMHPIPYAD